MPASHAHDHSHPHDHGAGCPHHDTSSLSDRKLVIAVIINTLLTFVQIAGGVISGSLALVADALHNLNDAVSLAVALGARRIARRPPDSRRTYGYKRAEIIGALVNVTALLVVGLFLVYEAVIRFFAQEPIDGWIVIWVAGIALIVDLGTALLTYAMSKTSLNVRAAFVHNMADALASVGVIIAGTLILLFDWYFADLLATVVISVYIIWHSWGILRSSIRILMQSVPPGLDSGQLEADIAATGGVLGAHHVHAWQLDEHDAALEAHVVVADDDLQHLQQIKCAIKDMLAAKYHITHSTLEFESPGQMGGEPCPEVNHRHRA